MGLVLTFTAGLIVWIVIWALGYSGFDSGMITVAILFVGLCVKILTGYLPGRRS